MIEKTNIIETVEQLNLKFYELFSKLDRYSEKLGDQMYNFMAQKLYEVYREEFERNYADYAIQRQCEKFKEKERFAARVPKRWKLFGIFRRKNQAASLIETEVAIETEKLFARFEGELFKYYSEASTETPAEESTPQATPEEPAAELKNDTLDRQQENQQAESEIPDKQGNGCGDQISASKKQSQETGKDENKQE